MRYGIQILTACMASTCIGLIAGLTMRSNAPAETPVPAVGRPEPPSTPTPAVVEAPPSPYEIVETEDSDLAGRRRRTYRVVIKKPSASSGDIESMLLSIAESSGVDAVFVFAYWPGDRTSGAYTAGRLEWGRNGGGWASTSRLPSGGLFDSGRSPLAGNPEEVEAGVARTVARSIRESRRGTVNYSIATRVRNAWKRNRMGLRPDAEQKAAVMAIFELVDSEISNVEDREATLDFIRKDMDSW